MRILNEKRRSALENSEIYKTQVIYVLLHLLHFIKTCNFTLKIQMLRIGKNSKEMGILKFAVLVCQII